jgi:hypothetical protein
MSLSFSVELRRDTGIPVHRAMSSWICSGLTSPNVAPPAGTAVPASSASARAFSSSKRLIRCCASGMANIRMNLREYTVIS